MPDRTTVGDLIDAVNQIVKLTGKDYRIRNSGKGKGYNLVLFQGEKSTVVRNAQPAGVLYAYLQAYFVGLQDGLNLPNADLTDPETALKRIAGELTTLQGAAPKDGEYPSGYHNNVLKAINAVNAAKDYAKGGDVNAD